MILWYYNYKATKAIAVVKEQKKLVHLQHGYVHWIECSNNDCIMYQKYKNKSQFIGKNKKIKIDRKTKEQKEELEAVIALYNLRTNFLEINSKKIIK